MRMQAHSCADVGAHACSDIDSYALADRHAHAGADVHVRACLHAPYHARCGLMGTHSQACTMTHARARPRTQSSGPHA